MTRSRTRTTFFLLVAGLLVAHVWPIPIVSQTDGPTILWGFVPWDLAYHLLWMVAAAGVILFMTERVWRDDEEGSP